VKNYSRRFVLHLSLSFHWRCIPDEVFLQYLKESPTQRTSLHPKQIHSRFESVKATLAPSSTNRDQNEVKVREWSKILMSSAIARQNEMLLLTNWTCHHTAALINFA
jgi:hypothetical protein